MDPLVVSASLEALPAIGSYVMAAAAASDLDRKAAYRLRLAVDEIATNAVVHGRADQAPGATLTLHAEIDQHTLRMTLEDRGVAYDPRQRPLPGDLDKPLEERDVGGLGIFLTLRGVDEYLYERDGEVNRNIFVVRRPRPDPSPSADRSNAP